MKQTTLRLPDELHKTLKREAGQRGMTLNAYIISVLWSRSETHLPDAEKKRYHSTSPIVRTEKKIE